MPCPAAGARPSTGARPTGCARPTAGTRPTAGGARTHRHPPARSRPGGRGAHGLPATGAGPHSRRNPQIRGVSGRLARERRSWCRPPPTRRTRPAAGGGAPTRSRARLRSPAGLHAPGWAHRTGRAARPARADAHGHRPLPTRPTAPGGRPGARVAGRGAHSQKTDRRSDSPFDDDRGDLTRGQARAAATGQPPTPAAKADGVRRAVPLAHPPTAICHRAVAAGPEPVDATPHDPRQGQNNGFLISP
ncbi:hypothetical protein UG55_10872 [Frankia sp. EI5c]|nr:hypothetical protein UG55_10872 [Frankia sp. EI5c]